MGQLYQGAANGFAMAAESVLFCKGKGRYAPACSVPCTRRPSTYTRLPHHKTQTAKRTKHQPPPPQCFALHTHTQQQLSGCGNTEGAGRVALALAARRLNSAACGSAAQLELAPLLTLEIWRYTIQSVMSVLLAMHSLKEKLQLQQRQPVRGAQAPEDL